MIHKIPLGFHKATKRLLTVMAAKRGKKCACECPECEEPLIAAQGKFRQYFRHVSDTTDCQGRPETLGHRLGKAILKESSAVYTLADQPFYYDQCDIEHRRYGKQPDAYLINTMGNETLIVEIHHSHAKTNETLSCFWAHDENILEINIQGYCFDQHFSYDAFKNYVLHSGPRTLHVFPTQQLPVHVRERRPVMDSEKNKGFASMVWYIVLFLCG